MGSRTLVTWMLRAALERLDFSWNENFGDAAAQPLRGLKRITYLDLAYCDQARRSSSPWGLPACLPARVCDCVCVSGWVGVAPGGEPESTAPGYPHS